MKVYYNFNIYAAEDTTGVPATEYTWKHNKFDTTTGYGAGWTEHIAKVTVASGSTQTLTFANMGFPSGSVVQWFATVAYGGAVALASQFLTLTIDGAATTSKVSPFGGGQAATSLAFANASGADATISISFFVRTT